MEVMGLLKGAIEQVEQMYHIQFYVKMFKKVLLLLLLGIFVLFNTINPIPFLLP